MKKKTIMVLFIFVLLLTVACGKKTSDHSNETVTDPVSKNIKYVMSASWTGYRNIEDIAIKSDIIAQIKVKEITNPVEINRANGISMYSTYFVVSVDKLLYGEETGDIRICMTGAYDTDGNVISEIDDDPLMKVGEEYLIFARKNTDGSFTILSGPSGRFVVREGRVYSNWIKYHGNPDDFYDLSDGAEYDEFVDRVSKAKKKTDN